MILYYLFYQSGFVRVSIERLVLCLRSELDELEIGHATSATIHEDTY